MSPLFFAGNGGFGLGNEGPLAFIHVALAFYMLARGEYFYEIEFIHRRTKVKL